MIRRRLLQVFFTLLTSSGTVNAESETKSCEYLELTDGQLTELQSKASEYIPLLDRVRSGQADLNYIYPFSVSADEIVIDDGNGIEQYKTDSAVTEVSNIRIAFENHDLPYGFKETACGKIPFNRYPDPHFDIKPDDPTQIQKVVLDGRDTILEHGAIRTYSWEVNNEKLSKNGEVIRTSLGSGVNIIELTVTTHAGITETVTKTVDVDSVAKLSPAFEYNPVTPTAQETVTFNASATTAEAVDIQSYEWDFDGDGTVDTTGVTAVRRFEQGEHVVSLTVQDAQGNEKTTEQVVEVEVGKVNISITATETEVTVGEETVIQYSVTNFLSTEELIAKLLVETPSDVSVTGVSGAEGSNQFTAEATIPPGEQQRMRITLQVNAVGQHEITAVTDYHTTGGQSINEEVSKNLLLSGVDEAIGGVGSDPPRTTDDTPGFGIGSGVVTIGGAGYLVKKWQSGKE